MGHLFHEVQYFHWWVYAIVAGAAMLVLLLAPTKTAAFGMLVFLAAVVVLFLRFETTANDQNLIVHFGWLPVFRKQIPLSEIEDARACTYRPVRDFLGWGWRWGRGRVQAFTAKGVSGVCLTLRSGQRYLIGSTRSNELASMLKVRSPSGI